MTSYYSRIIGAGAYLPENKLSNDDFAERYSVDTNDEWIRQRTGICYRHFVSEGEGAGDMAINAGRQACKNAGVSPEDIDLVILATSTPDNTFPATAAKVQAVLKTKGAAFDVQAVCAGFTFALAQVDNMIRLGKAKKALVIGSEVYSRILNFKDRTTCVLFGDGAGAVVVTSESFSASDNNSARKGVLATKILTDGSSYYDLYVDGGYAKEEYLDGKLKMNGREVFIKASVAMSQVVLDLLDEVSLKADDLNWYIPHQANIRIIDVICNKIGIPKEKAIATIAEHANVSSASIPIALTRAIEGGKIKSGDLIALSALGGGFAWGGAIVRW